MKNYSGYIPGTYRNISVVCRLLPLCQRENFFYILLIIYFCGVLIVNTCFHITSLTYNNYQM